MLAALDLDLLGAEVDALRALQHQAAVDEYPRRPVREQPELVFAARLAVEKPVPGDPRRFFAGERAEPLDRLRRRARIELGVHRRSRGPAATKTEAVSPTGPARVLASPPRRSRAGARRRFACATADVKAWHVGRCRCADGRTAGTSAPRGRRRSRAKERGMDLERPLQVEPQLARRAGPGSTA